MQMTLVGILYICAHLSPILVVDGCRFEYFSTTFSHSLCFKMLSQITLTSQLSQLSQLRQPSDRQDVQSKFNLGNLLNQIKKKVCR
jgi:hypothetical protein